MKCPFKKFRFLEKKGFEIALWADRDILRNAHNCLHLCNKLEKFNCVFLINQLKLFSCYQHLSFRIKIERNVSNREE